MLVCTFALQAAAYPGVRIEFLHPPKKDLLELGVGESHTFRVEVTGDEPFILALALSNEYYPGRGVFWHGGDHVSQDTYALLELTMTGKNSTADLWAVCDWPEPGVCRGEGVAPVAIAAGVRFPWGVTIAEQFSSAIEVPWQPRQTRPPSRTLANLRKQLQSLDITGKRLKPSR